MHEPRVKAALTPDFHSQAAYTGRLTQTETVTVVLEDGTAVEQEVTIYISWDTIKNMLAMVANRAGVEIKSPRKINDLPYQG